MDWVSSISYPDEPIATYQIPEELEHLLVAHVEDSSMQPKLSRGDRVVYDPKRCEPEDGQMVVIRRAGEQLVRWARRHPSGRLAFASGDGSEIERGQSDDIRVEGTVLMLVRTPLGAARPEQPAPPVEWQTSDRPSWHARE